MSDRAKALVGRGFNLAGKSAIVKEWSEFHPEYRLKLEGVNPEDETSSDGWLKVALVSANKDSGQWWRYSLLTKNINK